MIAFSDFFDLLNNIYCDFDGAYEDQCVDLVQYWSRAIGGQRFTGDAQDLFNQAGDFYTQVKNTPNNFPVEGDIVVWSSAYNGTVGHVGIATNNCNKDLLEVLEQNDPLNSNCHVKQYNYTAVLGWLHPKQLPQNQQAIIDELRKARDENWNKYESEVAKNNDLTNENTGLKTQISQVNQADASLLDNYKKKLEEDATAIDVGLVAEKERQQMYDLLHVSTTKDALEAIVALQKPHEEVVKQVVPLINKLADAAFYKRIPKATGFLNWIKNIFKKGGKK